MERIENTVPITPKFISIRNLARVIVQIYPTHYIRTKISGLKPLITKLSELKILTSATPIFITTSQNHS